MLPFEGNREHLKFLNYLIRRFAACTEPFYLRHVNAYMFLSRHGTWLPDVHHGNQSLQ